MGLKVARNRGEFLFFLYWKFVGQRRRFEIVAGFYNGRTGMTTCCSKDLNSFLKGYYVSIFPFWKRITASLVDFDEHLP